MWVCPLCRSENSTMVCICGFDKSRDYESYPTFGRITAGVPSVAARMKREPRKAVVQCPECGLDAVIYEQVKNDLYKPPQCSCGAATALLDPSDRFYISTEVFHLLLKVPHPWGLLRMAEVCMSAFQYGDPSKAQWLADTFSSLARDPASLGIELSDSDKKRYASYANQAYSMLRQHNTGKNIFDD